MEQTFHIKKAVIPIAGLGTRFLPLSKVLQKELLPLADKPIIHYLIEEAQASGIKEIIFVIQPGKKMVLDYFENGKKVVLDYFQKSPKVEKILKERKREHLINELQSLEEILKNLTFSFVHQKEPLGDGHAILQTAKLVGDESFGAMFSDDIIDSRTPALLQLEKIFKTCQKPVIAIHRVDKDKLSSYGVVKIERISNRLYKIKGIVEKPKIENAPSDLAIVGKYILTPEVFHYLRKIPPNERGEIILAEALMAMIKDGKVIYGYEFEGEWWECGNMESYLKSNLYFSLNNPKFGPQLKKFLREIK